MLTQLLGKFIAEKSYNECLLETEPGFCCCCCSFDCFCLAVFVNSCVRVYLLRYFWQREQHLDITCPWCQLAGWSIYSVGHDSYKKKICHLMFFWDIFVHSFRNTRCGVPDLSLILGKTCPCLSFQSLPTVSSFLSLAQLHQLDFNVVVVKSWPRSHWFTSSPGFNDTAKRGHVKWSACICYKRKICHICRERL